MTTDKPKRTVNRNAPIGIGTAIDRLVQLFQLRAKREAHAVAEVRTQLIAQAVRILERVPADLRGRVVVMLMASDDASDRELAEILRARLSGSLGAKPVSLEADPDIKKREPGCLCHQEEGDSLCPVHVFETDALPTEDEPPDMIAIPPALQTPYVEGARMTGKGRSK